MCVVCGVCVSVYVCVFVSGVGYTKYKYWQGTCLFPYE